MKKITLLTFVFLLGLNTSFAQCTSNVFGFGNNSSIPMYNIQGNVAVVLNTNNTISVNTASNFFTASGPDVRVYLVDRGNLTTAQLRNSSMFMSRPRIEMGLISGNGAQTFTKPIPAGVSISNYNTVYFFCLQFNAFWDFGSFAPFTNISCASLANDDFAQNRFKVYPNPVKNEVKIDFDTSISITEINVYAITGQLVYASKETITPNQAVDISAFNQGVFILEIVDGNNSRTTKRITKL